MKIREKRYLFEGFLNVLWLTLIGLATGFFMGSWLGILVGSQAYAVRFLEFCAKYPQYHIEECSIFSHE